MSYERPMFAATETLRTRRTRTGSLGPVTLPRTVELLDVFIAAAGMFCGLIFGAIFGGGWESLAWGSITGGALAIFISKFQPIRHHSLYRLLRLWLAARRGRSIVHDGRRVRMAIGIAVIDEGPRGPMLLRAGAVEINPDNYDERGVPK